MVDTPSGGSDSLMRFFLPPASHTIALPSQLPVTILLESGKIASPRIGPLCPFSCCRVRNVLASHTRAVKSVLPLTNLVPSGNTATQYTELVWFFSTLVRFRCAALSSGFSRWRLYVGQTRTVQSEEAETIRSPSGKKAIPFTLPWCPSRVCSRSPRSPPTASCDASHRRTVPSTLQEARVLPSEVMERPFTASVCAWQWACREPET
mmetsp:Transcript_93871/g.251205  ORF Transcript_93871/g.251205 Transcript_93871/m.251205 type:complete len:207 (-) Transcript_93871:219-839(-)